MKRIVSGRILKLLKRVPIGIMFLLLVCVQIFESNPVMARLKEKVHTPLYDSVSDFYGEGGFPASGPDWQDITAVDVTRTHEIMHITLAVNGEFPAMDTSWDGAIMVLVDIDGDGEAVPTEGIIDFTAGNLDYGIFIPSPEFGEPPIYIWDTQMPFDVYDTEGATYSVEADRIEIEVTLSHIGNPDGVIGFAAAIRTGITTDLVEDRVPNEGLGNTKPGYELFGPRADRMIIKTYDTAIEMLSALENGDIDIAYNVDNRSIEYKLYYTGGTDGIPVTPDDGENNYRGKPWVNILDSIPEGDTLFFDSIGMHPLDYELGDGENMTIRVGFTLTDIPDDMQFNVLYSLMSLPRRTTFSLECLVERDPYTLQSMPWLAEDHIVGTWLNPDTGENCTKVTFTLRSDMTWHDGTPLTSADVYFSLVELPRLLEDHGFPPPVWIDNIANITDFKILDPYNFEVLCQPITDTSAFAMCPCIVPMHIWKPIIVEGDPTTNAPDPNMIGSGPWRFVSYDSSNQLTTFKANRPGSTPITSPKGCWTWLTSPSITTDGNTKTRFYVERVPPEDVDLSKPVDGKNWTRWLYGKGYHYRIIAWEDKDSDGLLTPGDKVQMKQPNGETAWYTLRSINILQYRTPPYKKYMYLDIETDPQMLHVIFATITNNQWLSGDITTDLYVYVDDTLLTGYPKSLLINPGASHTETVNMSLSIGVHNIKVATYVAAPSPWAGQWQNATENLWVTITEDVTGSNYYDDIGLQDYPHKWHLPTPDFKVDILDIALVAAAFGSTPGDVRWSLTGDVNEDYMINILDIATIAKVFGWAA